MLIFNETHYTTHVWRNVHLEIIFYLWWIVAVPVGRYSAKPVIC